MSKTARQLVWPRWGIGRPTRHNDDCIFVDDGISGAVFGDGRPGLARLLNAMKPRQFDVLILSALDRVGRDQRETPYALQQINDAGVQVWSYLDAKQILLESELDVFFVSVQAFVASMEREKARQRTRDAMLQRAREGKVTGGRVFGYDNVDVLGPDGKRSHVERRINEAEAVVVRRIFELSALGMGLRAVAHTLNDERLPAPRPQRGRPAGWAPSSVREVLARPLYRGLVEYDRTRRDKKGVEHRTRTAQNVVLWTDATNGVRSPHGVRVFNGQAIDVDNAKASNPTQDEDPAGSQAREVKLERSGA